MAVYYNEIDPFAAAWLRSLIAAGHIPDGDVDERSIADVQPMDLKNYAQCHFFAGIGGWSHALRLAGWPDDRPIWTGSCPCQPFSVAGKGKGKADDRHLWPVFHQLIAQCRPPVVMGEQVAGKAGYDWFDGVAADLEAEGYASRAVDIPACAVDAPHIRQRLYWVATKNMDDANRDGAFRKGREKLISDDRRTRDMESGDLADAERDGRQGSGSLGEPVCSAPRRYGQADQSLNAGAGNGNMADADSQLHDGSRNIRPGWGNEYPDSRSGSFWSEHEWLTGADGKTRRAKPGVRLLAHGLPNRVGRLRGYGNAIVPPLAAEVIKAFMDV